ncbi:hypothetical protein [uncultured Alistipes sp.]|uniref:hypothetical protein n=1 Tax=uncultured Alistipes sp. TaxID=538949 RepID=UPI00261E02A3|nr:hypothetical protein [uncultured Alistipes sp.]
MPKLYPVTLYRNTGFNAGNLPASFAAVNTVGAKQANGVFLRQSFVVGTIRLDGDFEDYADFDYCAIGNASTPATSKIQTAYYLITGIQMISNRTVELSLRLDPLLTAGGISKLKVLGGRVTRAHVKQDNIWANDIEEPFIPSRPLVIRSIEEGGDTSTGTANLVDIVVATVDLTLMKDLDAAVAKSEDGTPLVAWPDPPHVNWAARFIIKTGTTANGYEAKYQGLGLFKGDNGLVQDGLQSAQHLGLSGIVQSHYGIPAPLVTATVSSSGDGSIYEKLTGVNTNWGFGSKADYSTVKNKKVFSQYNRYQIISICSGDTKEFEAIDLLTGQTITNPMFSIVSDPSPNGTVYVYPKWYQGKTNKPFVHAVAGLPWLNLLTIMNGGSGSTLAIANARRATKHANEINDLAEAGYGLQQEQAKTSYTAAQFNRGLGMAQGILGIDPTNPDSIAAGVVGAFGSAANMGFASTAYGQQLAAMELDANKRRALLEQSLGDRLFGTMASTRIVSPTIATPVGFGLQSYLGNGFYGVHITLSDEDVARFDKFLTMYGYAQDKDVEASDFNNRTKFNYLKTSDLQLTADGVPAFIIHDIEAALNNGARLWHVVPNAAAYADNPIAGGATT